MKLDYKAVNKEGKTVKGVIEGKNVIEVVNYLRSHEFLPIHVSEKKEDALTKYLPFLSKANSSDLLFFTRQLASMLSSGLTLMQSLNILREQVQNTAMTIVLTGLVTDIKEGKSFSNAITRYPQVFSPIYISLIKAAETSGLLDKILLRLADNLEKQQKLKGTIKGALMYPAIVVTGMVGVMTVMMIFVVPQLTTLYQNLDVALPLPTQIVIGISNFMVAFWPMVIGIVVFGIVFYNHWHKTEAGKTVVDDLMLKMPVFGKLTKQIVLTEFCRTLGLLVGSGALIVEALKETADVAGNVLYKNAVLGIARRVEKGVTIGDAMQTYPLFPPILVQMVKIGEETGKLDESLLKVSEYFEREVDQTVKTLTTALEPIIMVVLGLGVAFLIISIITPIYNLTSAIK